ncbi:unnamed protein product [Peronospora farinosa]|uniref:C2H2-type domain-containing protein n=1 Tax=Peronospora farinosa TaxID=134698 RepID=A0AAV0UI43_9STRA|nr:unnamed protein product [Peronospora farinosa]CAI5735435.1 unnamed protein product [Peronospora farinosa]
MKAKKKHHKTRNEVADVTMLDVSTSIAKPRVKRSTKSPFKASKLQPNAADKVAKFKEEKNLKIETKDLGQDVAEPDAEKAVPLSSTNKKRRRRSAAEIDRKHKCPYTGCLKAYGSEGSLIHHQKLKHPERMDLNEKNNQQVSTFLLPLHNATRNVMIRPAMPLMVYTNDRRLLLNNQSTNDNNVLAHYCPLPAKAPRRNMRSRSNSEPVTFIKEQTNPKVCIPTTTLMTKPRPKSPHNPRQNIAPHAETTATAARRSKFRSKSESLPEMNLLQPFEELKLPSYYRSNSSASAHEPVLPVSSTGSVEHGSFEWPATLISASLHHSTSLSSDEQAIDSDILSVLANCDAEDTGASSVLSFEGGPPSANSYQSSTSYGDIEDTGMLPVGMECFKIAENATLPAQVSQGLVMNEPEAELGIKAFATLGDDWANAMLLSDHLEKMSVAQGDTPPHSMISTFGKVMPSEGTVRRLCSASDPVHAADSIPSKMSRFSSVSTDKCSAKTTAQSSGDNELSCQNITSFQQQFGISCTSEVAKKENDGTQQMFWLSGEADIATSDVLSNSQPSSEVLDQLLQHDDTLEWKPTDVFVDDEVDYALIDTGMTPALL